MIQLFFDGEKHFSGKQIKKLTTLSENLIKRRKELGKINLEDMIELINNFSQNILKNPKTRNIEGIAFLSQWLKKPSIKKIIEINFENPKILSQYVEKKDKLLIAQPKGLVGHWVAGNVVMLGIFSLLQSIFVKNANILRISPNSLPIMIELLKVLSETEYNNLKGAQILSSTAIIYYPKEEIEHNNEFSMLCDARVIWGGEESVKTISNTQKKETCEDIIFGPKYSFSIIDKDLIEDKELLKKNIKKLVYDIIFSEQNSCTSPQVLICEVEYKKLKNIALELKDAFENLPEKYKKNNISIFQASNIIKIRSDYAMQIDKDLIISKGNDWTILIDKEFKLEEPIKSRTIFIKSCNDIKDVINLITPKIQTIGYAFKNKEKLMNLSKKLNLKGVSRIVPLGQMNFYDTPWDGKLLLARLVNINSLKLSREIK